DAQIARYAREIYIQAGRTRAMPPANITGIESGERKLLVDWYEAAVKGS
ncbi:MAG: cysteine desulfurase, partial [Alphaproteobacteria bacterium]|nr:cysteine desulfurase [Alphaproteobacteria bacterium]